MQPFLATECLGRDGAGGRRFIITFNMTRAIWRSPLLERYQTVSDDGSVKRFNISKAYTRARATDVADRRERRAMQITVVGGDIHFGCPRWRVSAIMGSPSR